MNKIAMTLDSILDLKEQAIKNGKLAEWAEVLQDWAVAADRHIQSPQLQQCQHVIVDCRNEVVVSGYMCTKCNAVFAAGDQGE